MSVDIYLFALKVYTPHQPSWGDVGPRHDGADVWFGDAKYVLEQDRLFALEGRQLTDELIAELLAWPKEGRGGVWDDRDEAKLVKFLQEHRGEYIDFWAS